MKRLVQWLVLGVALGGTAWAQEPPQPCERPWYYSEADWSWRSEAMKLEACENQRLMHQENATTRDYSSPMKYTGWAMVIFGAFQMIPNGTSYDIFGEDVCVTDYAIEGGRCSTSSTKLLVAAVTVGTGLVFAKIGGRQVAITPTASRQQVGVTAKVVW